MSQHVESERCGRTELKAQVRLVTPDLRPHDARESARPTMLLTRIARFRCRFDYDILRGHPAGVVFGVRKFPRLPLRLREQPAQILVAAVR